MSSIAGSLAYEVDLRLPGFMNSVPPGAVRQLSFDRRSSSEWYGEFVARIHAAAGSAHLPVYRMADGEFIFCVGERKPPLAAGSPTDLVRTIPSRAARLFRVLRGGTRTIWGESYSRSDRRVLMPLYVSSLRHVAENGLLALHFTKSDGSFGEEYFASQCAWFERNEIALTRNNYTSFYFVYALLSGPDRSRLVRRRKILIVSSFDTSRQRSMQELLTSDGARIVHFHPIPPSGSLSYRLPPQLLCQSFDVALVAAGIGAVSILAQLKECAAVCLDAGGALESLVNPGFPKRIFLSADVH